MVVIRQNSATPHCLPCYTAYLHVIHCKGALNFGDGQTEQENHEAEQRCNDTGQLLVFVLRTECSSDS
jgi:hypothetical protein